MKSKLITAGIVLAVTFVSGNAPPAYARGGGAHVSGGFHGGFHSGFNGGGRSYTGGSRGYVPSHATHGYGNYAARYTPAGIPRNYGNYGSRSVVQTGTHPGQFAGINHPRHSATSPTLHNRRGGFTAGSVTTGDGRTPPGSWSRHNPANSNRFSPATQNRLRNWNGRTSSFAEARHHHNSNGHHHGRDWWHNHCGSIILVGGGYWRW